MDYRARLSDDTGDANIAAHGDNVALREINAVPSASPEAAAATTTTTTTAGATGAGAASRTRGRPSRGSQSQHPANNYQYPRLRRYNDQGWREPSIRLRRQASTSALREDASNVADFAYTPRTSISPPPRNAKTVTTTADGGSRRRSSSEPQRAPWMTEGTANAQAAAAAGAAGTASNRRTSAFMPPLREEANSAGQTPLELDPEYLQPGVPVRPGLFSRASTAARSALGMRSANLPPGARPRSTSNPERDEYEAGLVDFLDVVDPEIATLATLTNVQNSLFIPDLGSLLNRRPTYTLTRGPSTPDSASTSDLETPVSAAQLIQDEADGGRPAVRRTWTIDSRLTDAEDRYAVLPHGVTLDGWTEAEKKELNDHVRHMLHSKRAAFKRTMKGFGQYVRRPLGAFVTIYAFLITVFGFAWVLFLIGWINLGSRKDYIINVIDNVLVALFAVIGDGLAPFRAVDTYHMIYIAHYHHLTWSLREKKQLPDLQDHNDLPHKYPRKLQLDDDIEAASIEVADDDEEYSVLTPDQQRKLKHHQDKFSKSHTFYKPHETTTHHAFPLRLLIAIVVLLDCHSLLQIALGTCTWSISYHVRPFALTTVILCCSLTCNITGGVLIGIGDRRTRKKDVVKKLFRQDLTRQAMEKIEKRREREGARNQELERVVDPVVSRTETEESVGGKEAVARPELPPVVVTTSNEFGTELSRVLSK